MRNKPTIMAWVLCFGAVACGPGVSSQYVPEQRNIHLRMIKKHDGVTGNQLRVVRGDEDYAPNEIDASMAGRLGDKAMLVDLTMRRQLVLGQKGPLKFDDDGNLYGPGIDIETETSGMYIYEELTPIVSCVPEARKYAESAADYEDTWSSRGTWAVVSGIGSVILGTGLIVGGVFVVGLDDADPDAFGTGRVMLLSGLGTMLVGGGVMGFLAAQSYGPAKSAQARSLDAVNAYNDQYDKMPACKASTGSQ